MEILSYFAVLTLVCSGKAELDILPESDTLFTLNFQTTTKVFEQGDTVYASGNNAVNGYYTHRMNFLHFPTFLTYFFSLYFTLKCRSSRP